jgi:hypothetical protein
MIYATTLNTAMPHKKRTIRKTVLIGFNMSQTTVKSLLQPDSQLFSGLLKKLHQFNCWNSLLANFPFDEPKLLEHCQIIRIDQLTLIMLADNPHWAARLRFYTPELITFLKKYPDFTHIHKIHCKIRPLQYQPKIKKNENKLSKESAEILLDIAKKVGNSPGIL